MAGQMAGKLAALVVLLAAAVEGSRILVATPYCNTKSNHNTFVPLVKELAERGHSVTIITNIIIGDLRPLANVRQIEIKGLEIRDSIFSDLFHKAINSEEDAYLSPIFKLIDSLMKVYSLNDKVAVSTYSNPQVVELLASDTYDLVLVSQFFGMSSYPLAWHFNASLAVFSPNSLQPGLAGALGDYEHSAHIPSIFLELTNRMSLPQRVLNTVVINLFDQLFTQLHKNSVWEKVRSALPGCPPLDDIERDISLVFTNSHPVFHYQRPMTPEMVEIGGIHCKEAKPLPTDLEEFVGDHEPGFIMFAVGSAIRMNDMPQEMLDAFIQVFSRLPQRVIWQWKGNQRPHLPANVMAVNWLPQQDLLGHKNCRLFLTHGGLNSLMEAVYHGVPVLGFPLSNDQFANLARGQREGYARQLKWKDITQESVLDNIQEMINDPRYSETADRLSVLFRDQPQTPLERAVYWAEFNLRHNGAKHLRLGSRHLAPYQRSLLDVYAVIAAIIAIPVIAMALAVRKCFQSRTGPVETAQIQVTDPVAHTEEEEKLMEPEDEAQSADVDMKAEKKLSSFGWLRSRVISSRLG